MSVGRFGGAGIRAGRGSTRPGGIFIGLVALFLVTGWMTWSAVGSTRLAVFLFVVTGWVVSLCLHEYAHALLAYRAGDTGVVERGYLTLNPLRYAHPILSIVLPVVFLLLGGIGLPGGAVWVDRHLPVSRATRSMISIAGPAVNLLAAIALVVPFMLGVDTTRHVAFWAALAFLAFLQLTATVLNLLPIPGLDGGNALAPWLNPEWQRGFDQIAPWGLIAVMVLLTSARANHVFFSVVDTLGAVLGLPAGLPGYGFSLFQFWM